jgi:hypothetical protein
VPAPGDYDDGEIGGMMIDRGNIQYTKSPTMFFAVYKGFTYGGVKV